MARASERPDSRIAGMATSAPRTAAAKPAPSAASDPRHPGADRQMGEGGRPDRGERGVAERHLARQVDEQHHRCEEHHEGRRIREHRQPRRRRATAPRHRRRQPRRLRRGEPAAARDGPAGRPPARFPRAADGETSSTTNSTRNGRLAGRPASQRDRADLARRDRGHDADGQSAEERVRQVREAADGRCAECLDDQECEQHGVEADGRSDQQPREGGEHRPDRPTPIAAPGRAGSGEVEQRRVVHHGAHRGPEPGDAEERREPERRGSGDGGDDRAGRRPLALREPRRFPSAGTAGSSGPPGRRSQWRRPARRAAVRPFRRSSWPSTPMPARGRCARAAGRPPGRAQQGTTAPPPATARLAPATARRTRRRPRRRPHRGRS